MHTLTFSGCKSHCVKHNLCLPREEKKKEDDKKAPYFPDIYLRPLPCTLTSTDRLRFCSPCCWGLRVRDGQVVRYVALGVKFHLSAGSGLGPSLLKTTVLQDLLYMEIYTGLFTFSVCGCMCKCVKEKEED